MTVTIGKIAGRITMVLLRFRRKRTRWPPLRCPSFPRCPSQYRLRLNHRWFLVIPLHAGETAMPASRQPHSFPRQLAAMLLTLSFLAALPGAAGRRRRKGRPAATAHRSVLQATQGWPGPRRESGQRPGCAQRRRVGRDAQGSVFHEDQAGRLRLGAHPRSLVEPCRPRPPTRSM